MRIYFKGRGEIFAVAGVIGGLIAGVWFVYRAVETWNHFNVSYFRPFVLYFCVGSAFLPTLMFYLALYSLNRLLIGASGSDELKARKAEIMIGLVNASIASGDVEKTERDLVDELAWSGLKSYWREP